MRRAANGSLLLCVLCSVISWGAGSAAASQFRSSRPLFARIAVTQDGSKVLSVAFDESRGAGGGYDTIYADTNFDGAFDVSEKHVRHIVGVGRPAALRFPRVLVPVRFSARARSASTPSVLQFDRIDQSLSHARRGDEVFSVELFVPLEAGVPALLSSCPHLIAGFKPCTSLASARVVGFGHSPVARLTGNPDPDKPGNTAIGIDVVMGDWTTVGGTAPTTLVIADSAGKVVHRGSADPERFRRG